METIMKIPFLLAMMSALITGFVSIAENADTNQTCTRMIIALVVFYVIGLVISSTLKGIIEEQNKRREEAEKQKLEEERLILQQQEAERLKQEAHLGGNLDLIADNKLDDGFSPLDLSQAIKTKIK